MFWKKKPKEEKNAAPPPPPPPPPPQPQRAEARPEVRQPPQAPRPTPQPAVAPSPGGGAPAQLAAVLSRRAGPQSAPMTLEAIDAQKRALESLLSDAAVSGATRDLANDNLEAAFTALERDATNARSAEKWRRVGAILYGVDGPRARKAYEQAFALDQRDFWGCIFLARLRALSQDLDGANLAASTAIMAGRTPDERGVAFFEAALIAMGRGDFEGAVNNGAQAVDASRAAIKAGAREAVTLRDLVARLTLLADANVVRENYAAAQQHYAEALAGARKLAAAAGAGSGLEKGVAELLEKSASVAASARDYEYAIRFADEAVSLRRGLLATGGPPGARTALAGALNSLGEIQRLAGLTDAATASLRDAHENARQAIARDAADHAAQRDLWLSLWRLASIGNAGVGWRDVTAAMEKAVAAGMFNPKHQHFFDEARRRAAS